MAQLSIIIPANTDSSALEDTLVSVLTHCPSDCEILVPHAGTYDDPYGMGDEIRLLDCEARSNTGDLVAEAMAASQGEIVHLLSSGCEVTSDWCERALKKFDHWRVGAVSPAIGEVSASEQFLGVARGFGGARREVRGNVKTSEKLSNKVAGPSFVAAFYRRQALEMIGGWPTDISFTSADLDVALSLREAGFESWIAADSLIAAREIQQERNGAFRNSFEQEKLFWRHDAGNLSRNFRPVFSAIQCIAAGMPWNMGMAACGKFLAGSAKASGAEHRQRIAAAASELADRVEQDPEEPGAEHRRAA